MNLTIVLEKSNAEWFGSCEAPHTFISTTGENVEEIKSNVVMLLEDHLANEGATQVEWQKITITDINFDYQYDLSSLFEQFKVLNVSEIAIKAGVNKSLLLQYKRGLKHASQKQAKKIEQTIHDLGKELLAVSVA
jgi:hypothetical protein